MASRQMAKTILNEELSTFDFQEALKNISDLWRLQAEILKSQIVIEKSFSFDYFIREEYLKHFKLIIMVTIIIWQLYYGQTLRPLVNHNGLYNEQITTVTRLDC